MTSRQVSHVKDHPLSGDVIEITEKKSEDGESFNIETMIRVVAFHEERVWFKEYGKGHFLCTLSKWKERLSASLRSVVIRGADFDAPF